MHTIQNLCFCIKDGYWLCAELIITVLVGQGLKQASLGQCILKAMKSNSVIPPFLFGLTVEIDHATERYWQKFQSWYMLDLMMKLKDINSQDGSIQQARSPQKWVYGGP